MVRCPFQASLGPGYFPQKKQEKMELEEFRLQLADLGRKDLYFFCKAILGFTRLSPDLHRELCWAVSTRQSNRKLIIIPRGHYKSTIATKGYAIQRLVQDPNERILISSATATNAERFLRHIKAQFEQNVLLKWLYPEIYPDFNKTTWSNKEIILRRSQAFPEPSVDTCGVGTAITGRHYTIQIKDDIVDDKNTNTPELIEGTIDWDASTIPLFDDPEDPTNEEVVIGTPWHKADIYSLKRVDSDYIVYIRHSLENAEGGPDYAHGEPIFPERFPRTKLEKIRKRIGNDELFFCQYMCDPRGGESSQFRREWLKFYQPSELPNTLHYFIACDPGGLRPDAGDYTAYVVGALDASNNLYILHASAVRHNPREIIDTWFELMKQFPDVLTIGVETVAYQKSLIFFAVEEMRRRNVFLPIRELKTSTRITKEMRIRSLIPRFSNGTVFLREGQTELVDQLLDFPKGRHDDLADALAYLLQLLIVPSEPLVEVLDPFSMEAILTELAKNQRLGRMGKLLETRLSDFHYVEPTLN